MRLCLLVLLTITSHAHVYQINYNNEQQAIEVSKGDSTVIVHYGEIVDIGNERKIVYVGNGNWRENDHPSKKKWSKKLHRFDAEDVDSWKQFVLTGFQVLDNQLERNRGFLDVASAHGSSSNLDYDDEDEEASTSVTMRHHGYKYRRLETFATAVCVGLILSFGAIASVAFFCLMLHRQRLDLNAALQRKRTFYDALQTETSSDVEDTDS